MVGSFDEHAQEIWDFTRCQRPNGTFYGTAGKCKSGDVVGAKEKAEPKPKRAKKSSKVEPKVEPKPKQVKTEAKVEEKPEGKSYKVRASEAEKKGPLGKLKEKLGKKPKVGLGGLEDAKQVEAQRDSVLNRLRKHGVSGKDYKKAEKYWERRVSAAKENGAFAERLTKVMPKGFKPSMSDDGVILTKKTKSGDKVEVSFSPSEGFHFKVNGTVSAGTVKGRRAQLEVAMSVRDAYDSVIKALPEGAVIKTGTHNEDGKGAARQAAYERMGFSRPKVEGGDMYAVKRTGDVMEPASDADYKKFEGANGQMWFVEASAVDNAKDWMIIVFGGIE